MMRFPEAGSTDGRHRRKRHRMTDARMDGKLCVITGATSGIGLAAARRLAKGGANLVLVARNLGKAETVKAELEAEHAIHADIIIADFNRLSDVRTAGETIRGRYPSIDVLINCAGLFSTKHRVTADGHEMTFQVNHLAGFLLTALLLTAVTNAPQGRILQVNSFGHRFGGLKMSDLDWQTRAYLWPRAYGASKLAQLMAMRGFAALLKNTGATINAMHPGTVGTNIVQNAGCLFRWLMHTFKKMLLKNPSVSGEALYWLAAAPELNNVTGRYFTFTAEKTPASVTRNEALCTQLWETSLMLTGLWQTEYGTIEKTVE